MEKKLLIIGPRTSRGSVPIPKAQTWLESKLFPRGHSFRLPSRSRPGTQPLTRSPAHLPSPPFPEPAPRDLPGTGPWGGLVLSLLSRPCLTFTRRHDHPESRAEKRGEHPPGRSHMLSRAGPRVPSRSGRPPRSPARPGRPGAPPAARPCRRTGGRDRLLPRKFQVRKQGHTFSGEGQLRAELGSASSAGLSCTPGNAGPGRPGAEPRQESPGSRERGPGTGLAGVPRAPGRPFLRGSSSGLQLSLIGPG